MLDEVRLVAVVLPAAVELVTAGTIGRVVGESVTSVELSSA